MRRGQPLLLRGRQLHLQLLPAESQSSPQLCPHWLQLRLHLLPAPKVTCLPESQHLLPQHQRKKLQPLPALLQFVPLQQPHFVLPCQRLLPVLRRKDLPLPLPPQLQCRQPLPGLAETCRHLLPPMQLLHQQLRLAVWRPGLPVVPPRRPPFLQRLRLQWPVLLVSFRQQLQQTEQPQLLR
jgi:hypothetical protein